MLKFDHLTILVRDWAISRDWYVGVLGLKVEFEIPDRRTVALQDHNDFTLFLEQVSPPPNPSAIALTFQVPDVHTTFQQIAQKGVSFHCPPSKRFWGYGAELQDPDGYRIRLWDEKSMQAYG